MIPNALKTISCVNKTDWLKTKAKPYFHQISLDCIKKLVDCVGKFNKDEIDADTSFKIEKEILTDEIDNPEFLEFAIDNLDELSSYSSSFTCFFRITE
ncbi:MAG: hypothetical protein MAG551_01847 [Candidatus Scalindua arabica]|uniref:Uncharacterized protein n=1 Tax=Candidatus Scalindua arabica TaxID=1127984 RepID=A0A941W3G5_9BACT|nr:hypothetical protein [Candidatus Scalindua arabica]